MDPSPSFNDYKIGASVVTLPLRTPQHFFFFFFLLFDHFDGV